MGLDELKKIYSDAWSAGVWIRTWEPSAGRNGYVAAAGSIVKLHEAEKKLGRDIDHTKLETMDCIELGALVGTGKTREEACAVAVTAYKKYYKIT